MTTPTHRKRTPARLKVMAVVAVAASTLAVGALAGGARADDDRAEPQPETPVWVRAEEHRRLCDMIALMPSLWPATQVMRTQAEQPLGDAAQRAEWEREADLMPSYWPAAQAMRAAAEPHLTCPT